MSSQTNQYLENGYVFQDGKRITAIKTLQVIEIIGGNSENWEITEGAIYSLSQSNVVVSVGKNHRIQIRRVEKYPLQAQAFYFLRQTPLKIDQMKNLPVKSLRNPLLVFQDFLVSRIGVGWTRFVGFVLGLFLGFGIDIIIFLLLKKYCL